MARKARDDAAANSSVSLCSRSRQGSFGDLSCASGVAAMPMDQEMVENLCYRMATADSPKPCLSDAEGNTVIMAGTCEIMIPKSFAPWLHEVARIVLPQIESWEERKPAGFKKLGIAWWHCAVPSTCIGGSQGCPLES